MNRYFLVAALSLIVFTGCMSLVQTEKQAPAVTEPPSLVLSSQTIKLPPQRVQRFYNLILEPKDKILADAPTPSPANVQEEPTAPLAKMPMDLKRPGTTLIIGDSTMAIFDPKTNPEYLALHEFLDLDGDVKILAKGETRANWVKVELMLRPASRYYKNVQNAVISTGSNNLGSHDTVDDIWKTLEAIYADLSDRGIRVYACTLPPGKGIPAGLWAMNYPAVKAKRDELNRRIRDALHTGDVYHVIDLAAPLSKGGLADDADIERMAKPIARFPGDPAHASGPKMAEVILRELLAGTNKEPPGPYPDE